MAKKEKELKVAKVFKIKVYYNKTEQKVIAPDVPKQMRDQIPLLNIVQNNSLIMADRDKQLPPAQMPPDIEERMAELIVFEKGGA